jgi:hypothetical protein
MISFGQRQFRGPFMAPLWSPGRVPGLYAVLVPGWRLLMFHPVYFGHAEDLSEAGLLTSHPRYGDWIAIAGTHWNLYIASHEMHLSTEGERRAAHGELLNLPVIGRGRVDA